jgi:hypothetical protein
LYVKQGNLELACTLAACMAVPLMHFLSKTWTCKLFLLFLAFFALFACALQRMMRVTKEDLLVMKGMGVVLESYNCFGYKCSMKYLDFNRIISIFINEGLTTSGVK